MPNGSGTEEEFVYEVPEVAPPEPEPHVPRENIGVVRRLCTRPARTGCDRCLQVCPHEAISLTADDVPRIDSDRCTKCGLCCGVCDAFGSERVTLADLTERVFRLAKGSTPVYFTCAEQVAESEPPASNVVVLPCLAAMPPEFWCVVLREGVQAVVHYDLAYCDTCFAAGPHAAALFSGAIELAQEWAGAPMQAADSYPLDGTLWDSIIAGEQRDRRGLFSSAANEGVDIATGEHRRRNSATINDFNEKKERMRAKGFLHSDNTFGRELPFASDNTRARQKILVESVRRHPEHASRIPRWFAATDMRSCCGNGACVQACPTGARSLAEGEGAKAQVDFSLCIACGACIAACPTGACDFVQGNGLWLLEDVQETEQP